MKIHDSLTPDERLWFNIRCLIDATNDGGIISFYYNSGADRMRETLEDLVKIGAKDVISLIEKVNRLFLKGEPPSDIAERNSVIDSWEEGENEELFEKIDDEFYEIEEELEKKLESIIQKLLQAS